MSNTTVYHGEWSPFRQMRWVEVENVDTVDLEGHSVVMVDSIELEGTSRIIHKVKRPDADSKQGTLILGPHHLLQNKFGLATDSNLVVAQVLGSPSPGDELGTEEDSSLLAANQTGYVAVSQVTGLSGEYWRVMRSGGSAGKMVLAQLDGDVCAGAAPTLKNGEYLFGDGAVPTAAVNLMGLAGADNDWVVVVYRKSNDTWIWLQTSYEMIDFLEKLTEPSSTTAKSLSAGSDLADTECDFVFNKKRRPFMKEPCEVDTTDEINFAPKAVITDLRANGNCLEGKVKIIWSPAKCDMPDEWVQVLCGTDCPADSSGTPC